MQAPPHHEELMMQFDETFLDTTRGIYAPVLELQEGDDQECDFG